MKRLAYFLVFILLGAFVACENASTEDKSNTPSGDNTPDSTEATFTLTSGSELNISMNGGMATITYDTTGDVAPEDIEITISAEWLKLFDATTLGEIVVSAATNETGGTRMAAVVITLGSQVETVVINQSGIPDEPIISPTEATTIDIDRAGQSVTIGYTLENETFEGYTYAKYDAEWIYSVNTNTKGKVVLYVATNDTDESRTATIKIGYEGSSFDVVLTQAGEGDYNFTATHFNGDYYGDAYTPGAGNYFLKFSDRGFTGEGSSMPFGTYYRIDAYGPVFTEEEGVITLPEGEYTFDPEATYMTWTFVADYTDFFVNDANGKHTKKAVESGIMRVKNNTITLDLVIDGEHHTVTYSGSTEFTDLRGDINILTTLTEDYALDLSNHTMVYACEGDYYDYGYYNWMFVIKPTNGVGDCIQMDIITAYEDEESGFEGDYVGSDVLAPSSFIFGWTQVSDMGLILQCSWFHTADYEEIAPMRGGEVKVKKNDDGTYTVDIDVTDDLRNRIYGTWTGTATAYEE